MAWTEMYPAVNNSVAAKLTQAAGAGDTTLAVEGGALPQGPNLLTLGTGDQAELVRYERAADGQVTGCLRGYGGTEAAEWGAGTAAYRAYTAADHEAFRLNIEALHAMMYPVGSIYMSAVATDPAALFGGAWERIAKGRVLLGVDEDDPDFDEACKTGGAKAHEHALAIGAGGAGTTGGTALTVAQLPAHTHGRVSLTGWFGEWALQDSSTTEPYVGGIITASSTGSYQGYGTSTTGSRKDRINIDASHEHASVGSGQAHTHTTPNHAHTGTAEAAPANTLPPFETCYIWKRIA